MTYHLVLSTKKYFQNVCDAASRISAMIEFTKDYEDVGVLAPAWQNCRNLVETAGKEAKLGNIVVKNVDPLFSGSVC